MKQRNQVIILGVLLALLGVVAFIVLGGKNKTGGARAAGPTSGPSETAPAAAPGQADDVIGAPPSREELNALSAWLVPRENAEAGPSRVGFGLTSTVRQENTGAEARQPEAAPPLQGILVVGGQKMALIGGERYCAGQVIANSDFTVRKVGEDSVTLQTSDGRELVLKLVN